MAIEAARTNRALADRQWRAWRYYGLPSENTSSSDLSKLSAPIGEVRYVVGWMADQMTRLGWRVEVDGEPEWSVQVDGQTVSTGDDPDAASELLLGQVGWGPGAVRQLTTNLFVAGEANYVADAAGSWQTVSVVATDREKRLKEAELDVRALWPHPADPDLPDAPLFGVLDVCATIEWLSKLQWSQSANRVAMNGWLGVADGLEFADGGDLFETIMQVAEATMRDPTLGAVPAMLRGPTELAGAGPGGGPAGMSYLIPERPYDSMIDRRLVHAIERLAFGLPIPPEILTGMTATNRAAAYQIEEAGFRAHVEPPAHMVAATAAAALRLLTDLDVQVVPDPTDLLARRHSTSDVLEAADRGAVKVGYVLEVLGIPEDAVPDGVDVDGPLPAPAGSAPRPDPADQARRERPQAVAAAVEGNLESLSAALSDIDFQMRSELAGAAAMAQTRARERVGAAARSRAELKELIPDDVANEQVAATVGVDVLAAGGVDVEQTVVDAMEPLADWWHRRVSESQQTVDALVDVQLVWPPVRPSTDVLVDGLAAQTVDQLEHPDPSGPDLGVLRQAMAVAGGQVDGAIVAAATAAQPGGFAVGVIVMQALKDRGVTQTGWQWVYRPQVPRPTAQFPPHRDLAGSFHDEIPTVDGWHPEDHPGCLCDTRPVLRRDTGRFAPHDVEVFGE